MGSKWILAILWLLVLLVRLVVFCALFLTDIYGFAQVPWCRKIRQWCPCWGWTTHIWKKNKYISIIIIYIYTSFGLGGGSLVTAIFGRLWPQFLVACDRMNCYGVTFRGRRNIWSCWSVTSRGKRIIWWCWRVNFSGRRSIWWNLAQYWSSAL